VGIEGVLTTSKDGSVQLDTGFLLVVEEKRGRGSREVRNNLWKITSPWERGSPMRIRIQATTNRQGTFRPRREPPSQGGIQRRSSIRALFGRSQNTKSHRELGSMSTLKKTGESPRTRNPGTPRAKTGPKERKKSTTHLETSEQDATPQGDGGPMPPRLRRQRNAPTVPINLAAAPSS